jgi:hypothetical protein
MDIFKFDVNFDLATKKVSVPGLSDSNPLVTYTGLSLIKFNLVAPGLPLDTPSGVAFAGDPIEWLEGGPDSKPVSLPPWFLMHRFDDSHFALWNFHSAPQTIRHNFIVSVFYEGVFYSSPDPVIVNEAPSGT